MLLFVGIAAALVVLLLTSKWWADGLISGVEFFVLTGVYGCLGFGLFALTSRREFGAAVFVLIAIMASVGWALYCNQKLGIKQYYRDKIKEYERAIQADPRNTAARGLFAEAYYMLGDLDQAIAAMELVVQISPNSMKEGHTLRQWRNERDLRDCKTVICQVCHSANLWGSTTCRICQQPLVYSKAGNPSRMDWAAKNFWRIALGVCWLAVTIVSFAMMSPVLGAIVSGCGALAVVGILLLSSV
ncbi:MAG: tetratricopeptide repeat protein [Armatimonadota bacterium]